MTQTATEPEAETGPGHPPNPTNLLFSLLVTLLAPMFFGVAMSNIALARAAAAETVNDFRARNHADLLAIAQIIAFGLAALGSLSLSMDDDISVSMALRLRGNANACNRSAEQNRRALAKPPAEAGALFEDAWTPEPEAPDAEPEPFLSAAAQQLLEQESLARLQPPQRRPDPPIEPAPQTPEHPDRLARAADLMRQAQDLRANIANLPQAARHAAIERITKLTRTARLLSGAPSAHPSAA